MTKLKDDPAVQQLIQTAVDKALEGQAKDHQRLLKAAIREAKNTTKEHVADAKAVGNKDAAMRLTGLSGDTLAHFQDLLA